MQTWGRHCKTSRSCGIGIGAIRDERCGEVLERAVKRSFWVGLVYSRMRRRTGVPDDSAPSLLENAPHTAVRKDAADGRDPETAIQLCNAAGGKSLEDVEGPLVGRVGERVPLNLGFNEIDRVDESPTGDSGCVAQRALGISFFCGSKGILEGVGRETCRLIRRERWSRRSGHSRKGRRVNDG